MITKNLLLIGDSIRLSYQESVKTLLGPDISVSGPTENCRFTKYTLWYINEWIKEAGTPDLIHWNNGIWDIYRRNKRMGIFTAPGEYARNLKRIIGEMRDSGAQIVWASITPVADTYQFANNSDIDRYNVIAREIMSKNNIPVNDLNAVILNDRECFLGPDGLHLSPEGVAACAKSTVLKLKELGFV